MADASPFATLGGAISIARTRLAEAGAENPALDARLLVEHAAGASWSDIVARPDTELSAEAAALLQALLIRRTAGEPVHRIIGRRDFFGLTFRLSPGTLEPRPDTEALVERAIFHAREFVRRNGTCRLLDLGTGTGAIAIAILANVPDAAAVAVDISHDALETAAANADINGVTQRFSGVRSDWFGHVDGVFDIIVSNPPYIPTAEIATLARDVTEHDPIAALDGGTDGIDAYRIIARDAGSYLTDDGIVAVEIGLGQGASVMELFGRNGYRLSESVNDLAGRERALIFRMAVRD